MDENRPRDSLLWLVAIAVFMQMLDTTIVNTALPAMAAGLGESPLRMQAVVIAYALTPDHGPDELADQVIELLEERR